MSNKNKWKRKKMDWFYQWRWWNMCIEKTLDDKAFSIWVVYDEENNKAEEIGVRKTLKEAKAFSERWAIDNL